MTDDQAPIRDDVGKDAGDDAGDEAPPPYPYEGPEALRDPIRRALERVVDPEVSMSIIDVGLVYGVTLKDKLAQVRMTMTSAACPVADLIVEEVETELDRVLPPDVALDVQLCWEPPWTPQMMSPRGRLFMGW